MLPFKPCIFCLLSQLLRHQISKPYVQRENKTEMGKEKSLESLTWFAGGRRVTVLGSARLLLTQVHRHGAQGLTLLRRLCLTLSRRTRAPRGERPAVVLFIDLPPYLC